MELRSASFAFLNKNDLPQFNNDYRVIMRLAAAFTPFSTLHATWYSKFFAAPMFVCSIVKALCWRV